MAKTIIPLQTSSSTSALELGEALAINPYANEGVTSAEAPVLLSLEAEYTLDAASFAARMVKVGGQGTEAQARLMLNCSEAVLEDLFDAYGAITVQTPLGTVETFVSGTLTHAQDAPDPTANVAFLGLVVPETYREQFAQIETYVQTEAIPVALKRVRDKASGEKAICGSKTFYLEGRGMNYGGTGTKLELQNILTRTKICDVAVDAASKSPINLTCTLPSTTAVAVGTYWLELTSLNGDRLLPAGLKVEVAEEIAPTPTLTKAKQGDRTDNLIGFATQPIVLTGVFPGGFKSGDALTLEGTPDAGGTFQATESLADYVTTSADTTITLGNGIDNLTEHPDDEWNGKAARLTFVRSGTSYPLTVNFQDP